MGKLTEVKLVQVLNALAPITVTLRKLTEVKLPQYLNASFPIDVTFGKFTDIISGLAVSILLRALLVNIVFTLSVVKVFSLFKVVSKTKPSFVFKMIPVISVSVLTFATTELSDAAAIPRQTINVTTPINAKIET